MPILILGLVFVIGLFIYYLFSTSMGQTQNDNFDVPENDEDDETIKKEGNVIFLSDNIEEMKEKYKKKK